MTRLATSRRQKIGFTYAPQVNNNIAVNPPMRNMLVVQDQSFIASPQTGGGIMEAEQLAYNTPQKNMDYEMSKQIDKINFDKPSLIYGGMMKSTSEHLKMKQMAKSKGGAVDISDKVRKAHRVSDMLPGEMLRQKLLKKMVRERRMKSLGDRVKTSPIEEGFNGGSLVIPTINNKMGSQSMGQTLEATKPYKLNPKPLVGAGKKQKGGFIGMLAAAIAAISAAASAAAATTVVGSVTVGSLAGAALTGAAGVAGKKIADKIIGDGISNLKSKIIKTTEDTKIMFKKLPKEDQEKIKQGIMKLKINPSKEGVIAFSKSIAPMILKETKKELHPKLSKVFKDAGMSGKGLKLAGQGLGLAGSGEKKFKNEFVKNLVKKLS